MKLCSVIIPCWNGMQHLKRCIDAVLSQTYQNIDLIVIDNGSTDGSRKFLEKHYPKITLIKNDANKGFAAAQNQGIKAAKGDYILCLNMDAILEKDFIEKIIPEMEKDKKIGSAACKLLAFKTNNYALIDAAGHIAYVDRSFASRGHMEIDRGQYDEKEFVFGTCAAAAVYKKEMLEDIKIGDEYFDESYFAYFEDIDIDWRAQIRGWKCIYIPDAIAIHESKSQGISNSRNLKNRLSTIFKNDYTNSFFIDLPFIAISEINNLLHRYIANKELRGALKDFWRELPKLREKRKLIQKRRAATPEYMLSQFKMDESNRGTFTSFFLSLFFILALFFFLGFIKIMTIILIGYIIIGEGTHLILNRYANIHKEK